MKTIRVSSPFVTVQEGSERMTYPAVVVDYSLTDWREIGNRQPHETACIEIDCDEDTARKIAADPRYPVEAL